jgi:2-polyprenyl-6-methoxyphenol hydroxylase-like FAD-dependent oxidoreductase
MQESLSADVVIVGAGPTGLMLAGELALAGVDVAVVERRTSQELEGSRAGGLHARTIEVLDQRGIAERFLTEGYTVQVTSFAGVRLDISDFPTRQPYTLALWQKRFEQILADWVEKLGVPFHRGQQVTGFAQDETGVGVELAGGGSLRAQYLVGCDGGRSLIRKGAGIEFPGSDPVISSMVAEAEVTQEVTADIRHDERGTQGIGPLQGADHANRVRIVVSEKYTGPQGEPTLEDLSRALISVWGTDFGLHGPAWISRFTDSTRQAARYRNGRVLLAGDSAHVHYPVGGQGLNLGVQDAVNLGWKLAQVVNGVSPDRLLDTYHDERHPVAARVLRATLAGSALSRSDDQLDALRDTLADLLSMDEPRVRYAGMMSALDIHYDLGPGHPLLGRRMPDLDLVTADGPVRVFTLLHQARPVLLRLNIFGGADGADGGRWGDRVRVVDAEYGGRWELPVLGEVEAPGSVLVRPDGHVAWTGELDDPALPEALTTWCGTSEVMA